MRIDCHHSEDGTPVLRIAGRLDFSGRDEFAAWIERFLHQVTGREVHVNCSELDYLDSSGLGMLLILRDRALRLGCSVALLNCNATILAVLNTVQFGRLFRVA
ncbi:MAG: anti-sigma factor antagonist [Rhodocyclales bacterium GT-UBC]|nr:MAG: anti-sigma factor antagonist [Rhodocyclales bacterium GT-UBC]